MENLKFNEIIDNTIDGVINGVQRKVDSVLMNDLKRMSELGVLEIHQSQPDFKHWDINNKNIEVSIGCRLYFKGEDTIRELRKEIELLKAKDKDKEFIINGVTYIEKPLPLI